MNLSTPITTAGKRAVLAWLAALCLMVSVFGVMPAAAQDFPGAATLAQQWVEGQQQPDGSFPGFGAGSTVDAVLAFIALGADPSVYVQGGNTPVTFLQSKAAELARTPGSAGKLLFAVAALGGGDTRSFGGVDLVAALNSSYDSATGQYGKDAIGHAFAMLGLSYAQEEVPTQAVQRLLALQGPEGGWAFSGETAPGSADTNATAVAVQALIAAGESPDSPALQKAHAYLLSQQNPDGGFPYQKGGEFGSDSDVNSTSYVSQALITLNDFDTSNAAKGFLRTMQKPNGAFMWKAGETDDNPGATYQAIPALLDATLVTPYDRRIAISQPVGMPTTGTADFVPVGVLAAVALALLGFGLASRRRAATR